jgi:aryl-alcohol dehydrogenase-like predicted oxidoreductase
LTQNDADGGTLPSKTRQVEKGWLGLDLGMRLVDTADMSGNGESEKLVAEAIGRRRDDFFLVTKILPHQCHAPWHPQSVLGERPPPWHRPHRLYLLHWRGPAPLAKTIEAFVELRYAGKSAISASAISTRPAIQAGGVRPPPREML